MVSRSHPTKEGSLLDLQRNRRQSTVSHFILLYGGVNQSVYLLVQTADFSHRFSPRCSSSRNGMGAAWVRKAPSLASPCRLAKSGAGWSGLLNPDPVLIDGLRDGTSVTLSSGFEPSSGAQIRG